MEILQVFDKTIVTVQCTDINLFKNEDLNKSVEAVLNLPSVKNKTRNEWGDSQVGAGLTSVGETYLQLINLPGSNQLIEWISQQLVNAKSILKIEKPGNKIEYKRSWINRLYKGAQGKCHQHVELDEFMRKRTDYSNVNFRADVVAIFYVDIPVDSSQLVFINDGKPDTFEDEYTIDNKYYLKPQSGKLVIHTPEMWHAISKHNSNLHRTCFVFDANYA
jgi:hypothetical protein